MNEIIEILRGSKELEPWHEMLQTETHHQHKIVTNGDKIYWQPKPEVLACMNLISMNDLVPLFNALGFGGNSEVLRSLYRARGYALNGYWEIFYWKVNNPKAMEYKQPGS